MTPNRSIPGTGQLQQLAGGLMTVGLIAAAIGRVISLGAAVAGHTHNVHLRERFKHGAGLSARHDRLWRSQPADGLGVGHRRRLRAGVPRCSLGLLVALAGATVASAGLIPITPLPSPGDVIDDVASDLAGWGGQLMAEWVAQGAGWLVENARCGERATDPRRTRAGSTTPTHGWP
ncbi:MAG: hypothetical protein R3C15_02520 [Thermoleophilia bacterium]